MHCQDPSSAMLTCATLACRYDDEAQTSNRVTPDIPLALQPPNNLSTVREAYVQRIALPTASLPADQASTSQQPVSIQTHIPLFSRPQPSDRSKRSAGATGRVPPGAPRRGQRLTQHSKYRGPKPANLRPKQKKPVPSIASRGLQNSTPAHDSAGEVAATSLSAAQAGLGVGMAGRPRPARHGWCSDRSLLYRERVSGMQLDCLPVSSFLAGASSLSQQRRVSQAPRRWQIRASQAHMHCTRAFRCQSGGQCRLLWAS